MTALACVSPETFKAILEKCGFCVDEETEYNWTLLNKDALLPVISLPKKGKLLSVSIMMEILDLLKIDNGTYFKLLDEVQH
jgi:hypothetical protein